MIHSLDEEKERKNGRATMMMRAKETLTSSPGAHTWTVQKLPALQKTNSACVAWERSTSTMTSRAPMQ